MPANGGYRFTGRGSLLTASIAYECNKNYELLGISFNLCENRMWINPTPICVGKIILWSKQLPAALEIDSEKAKTNRFSNFVEKVEKFQYQYSSKKVKNNDYAVSKLEFLIFEFWRLWYRVTDKLTINWGNFAQVRLQFRFALILRALEL